MRSYILMPQIVNSVQRFTMLRNGFVVKNEIEIKRIKVTASFRKNFHYDLQ